MSQTTSEKLFEQFCDTNGVTWSRIVTGKRQTPDYEVQRHGVTVFVEIKELNSNPADKALLKELAAEKSAAAWSDAPKRIRNKIGEAVGQLKAHNLSGKPAVLLLFANGIFSGINGSDVRDAMYGNEVLSIGMKPNGAPGQMSVGLGGGGCCQPKLNTSLSAIAVMHSFDGTSAQLDIFENVYARVPLPPTAFDGIATQYTIDMAHAKTSWPPWVKITSEEGP